MCIKLVKRGGAVVGITFDIKRTIATILSVSALIGAFTVITAKCNSFTSYAQCKYVRPEAEKVFDNKIRPYDSALVNIEYNQRVTIEMIKMISNNPEILNIAIDKVNNTGKFPSK